MLYSHTFSLIVTAPIKSLKKRGSNSAGGEGARPPLAQSANSHPFFFRDRPSTRSAPRPRPALPVRPAPFRAHPLLLPGIPHHAPWLPLLALSAPMACSHPPSPGLHYQIKDPSPLQGCRKEVRGFIRAARLLDSGPQPTPGRTRAHPSFF